MRLKPTKNTIILLGGAQALGVLALAGVLWLQSAALARSEQTLTAKQLELNDGQAIARRQEAARTALEEDRTRIRFLETAVSNAAYVPTLLKQLEELAGSTRNQVLAVRPLADTAGPTKIQQRRDPDAAESEGGGEDEKEKKEKPEPYTRLNIQVTLVGGFESTQRFIERLTRFPKIIAVEQVSLRPHHTQTPKEGPSSLLDVELKLTAFVMKEQRADVTVQREPADAQVGGIN
jgi:hypothetical protein